MWFITGTGVRADPLFYLVTEGELAAPVMSFLLFNSIR